MIGEHREKALSMPHAGKRTKSGEMIERKGDVPRSCAKERERARKSEQRARESSAETLRALSKRRGELGSRSVEVGRDRRVSSGRGQKRAASSVIDKDSTDLAVCLLESI